MNKPSMIERLRRWRYADGPGPDDEPGDALGFLSAAPFAGPTWTAQDRAFEAELRRRLGGLYKGFTGEGYANRYGGGFVARTGGRKPSTYVLHHTAGSFSATGGSIWNYHVNTRKWNTDGYHVLVSPDGSVELLIPPSMMSYGAGTENPYTVHVCAHGNYVGAEPSTAMLASIHQVFLALDICYGNYPWRGHKELPNNSTVCPAKLQPRLEGMRASSAPTAPIPPGPAPAPGVPNMAKVVWALEQATRILEREGLGVEARFVANTFTAQAIRRRDGR